MSSAVVACPICGAKIDGLSFIRQDTRFIRLVMHNGDDSQVSGMCMQTVTTGLRHWNPEASPYARAPPQPSLSEILASGRLLGLRQDFLAAWLG